MARRGWVSAEVAPGVWRRLVVFDDGWVELPGFARGLSDTRAQLRTLLRLLAAVAVSVVALLVLPAVGAPGFLTLPAGLLLVVALVRAAVLSRRMQVVNARQATADHAQARAERDAGQRLRRAPGAPLLRRAGSARQLAGWLEGAVHVDAADVVAVSSHPATADEGLHRVTVRLLDERERGYASPDRHLPRLLLAFAR